MAFKNGVVIISLILALFMAQAPPMHAQAQLDGSLFDTVQVSLTDLRNTVTGRPVANTTSPVFSGALAQVRLGTTPLAVGITDTTGSLNITLNPASLLTTTTNLVNNLVNNGTIRILTLVLNQTSGVLTSSLVLIGNITSGALNLNIIRLGPVGFTLII